MTTRYSTPFTIRAATDNDIAACLQLDLSYETEYAWQMDVRDDDGRIMVGLGTVRLPRLMRVVYPREPGAFVIPDAKHGHFVVAETSEVVCGYLMMRFDVGRSTAWITDVALGRAWRRRKIGSALLQNAYQKAQEQKLRRLTVETQTKNYPGICFLQKNGLTFCGFNDRYFPNHDIALFFGQNVQL
jgi:ribosomal protein S18 acetylase RimI-like enzyme